MIEFSNQHHQVITTERSWTFWWLRTVSSKWNLYTTISILYFLFVSYYLPSCTSFLCIMSRLCFNYIQWKIHTSRLINSNIFITPHDTLPANDHIWFLHVISFLLSTNLMLFHGHRDLTPIDLDWPLILDKRNILRNVADGNYHIRYLGILTYHLSTNSMQIQ